MMETEIVPETSVTFNHLTLLIAPKMLSSLFQFYMCVVRCVIPKEEYRPRASDNKVIRNRYGHKKSEKVGEKYMIWSSIICSSSPE
jgi:hypothetical protein